MWGNSSQVNIHEALPQPETCGWNKESDSSFTFDWECNKVQQSFQNTSNFFDEGVFLLKKDVEHRGVAAFKVATSVDPAACVTTARTFCHILQHNHMVASVRGCQYQFLTNPIWKGHQC